jgi:hypothetical protein
LFAAQNPNHNSIEPTLRINCAFIDKMKRQTIQLNTLDPEAQINQEDGRKKTLYTPVLIKRRQ